MVLGEGAAMLADGGLCEDEAQEVRMQMKLLESRWEALRASAMEEQSVVYERLKEAQRAELLRIQNWLEHLEAKIAQLAMNSGTLEARLLETRKLESDLAVEEPKINDIRQLDIVDDSHSEEEYLQNTLTSVLERWSHAKQWVEDRCAKLTDLRGQEEQVANECLELQTWLEHTEATLKRMEVEPAEEIPQLMARVDQIRTIHAEVRFRISVFYYFSTTYLFSG